MRATTTDPAMKYEKLARAVFKCDKGEDPFGYAKQELYNHNFITSPTERGKRALATIFIKLIIDNNTETEIIDKLKKVEDSIWTVKNQDDIIKIIDIGLDIVDSLPGKYKLT